jgi:hypothetical protein
MTPTQLKLIQQLLKMGDVILFDRKKESVVQAIKTMDLASLKVILDDDLTYQDASKEVFLSKMKEIFDVIQLSNDTLQSHSGKCGSTECSNHNKNGILFCGIKSGKHFNLIIEEDENENVKDLYHCNDFKCNFRDKVNLKGNNLEIRIYEDEKASFRPSSHYNYINTTSLNAIAELKNFKNKTISKSELKKWLTKYADFYNSNPVFTFRFKNEHKFNSFYYNAETLNEYFIIEDNCAAAIRLFDTLYLDYEMNLLKWLSEYEQLKDSLILFYPKYADEKTGELSKVIFNQELNISIDKAELKHCIRFQEIINTYYYVLLDKYKLHFDQKMNVPLSDEDIEKQISLKYHLEQRNIFPDKISYKTKPQKNSFLYNNDDFGTLERGLN